MLQQIKYAVQQKAEIKIMVVELYVCDLSNIIQGLIRRPMINHLYLKIAFAKSSISPLFRNLLKELAQCGVRSLQIDGPVQDAKVISSFLSSCSSLLYLDVSLAQLIEDGILFLLG